ncbi:hypothetical protein RRG08_011838 [Elysia crispata]|uniref:Uncharacterized protein n=1 Tax=Elysia crispata TaxID=231223 RepID=A0AAE1AUE3_9GAST|nr:hypothetical protein RRG08_011838 [Elysia crispata]
MNSLLPTENMNRSSWFSQQNLGMVHLERARRTGYSCWRSRLEFHLALTNAADTTRSSLAVICGTTKGAIVASPGDSRWFSDSPESCESPHTPVGVMYKRPDRPHIPVKGDLRSGSAVSQLCQASSSSTQSRVNSLTLLPNGTSDTYSICYGYVQRTVTFATWSSNQWSGPSVDHGQVFDPLTGALLT